MVNRRYPTLGAWFDDLNLVFENAKEYNEPGSRVHRDAKLLLVSCPVVLSSEAITDADLASFITSARTEFGTIWCTRKPRKRCNANDVIRPALRH